MKAHALLLLGVATLGAGCVSSGPTPRHAPTVAYTPPRTYVRTTFDAPRQVYEAQAPLYVVAEPPPLPAPPREVVAVRPAREAVWVAGYYAYVGGDRYEWIPGHWEIPPGRGRNFDRPRWERRGNTYVYLRGGWR